MGYTKLLLIDDDEDDKDIFSAALHMNSQAVNLTFITDPVIALSQLSAGDIEPEIIFLDLNMPQMSGQEVLKQLKNTEATATIPIIVYSTSSSPETKEAVLKLGADDFVTKPEDFYELVNILKPLIS